MLNDAVAVTQYMTFASLREQHPDLQEVFTAGPNERLELERLKDPGRREAWVWGRVLARRCLMTHVQELLDDPERVEICTRNEQEQSIRPLIRSGERVIESVCLSITHTDRAVAVALSDECMIGIDLVDLEGFRAGVLEPWLTPEELQLRDRGGVHAEAVIWGAKEAAYKALNQGESFAPKQVVVAAGTEHELAVSWQPAESTREARVTVNPVDGHLCALACGPEIRPES